LFKSEEEQGTERVQPKGKGKRKLKTAGAAAGSADGANAGGGASTSTSTGGTSAAAGAKKPRKGKQGLQGKPPINPKAAARAKEILARLHKARLASEDNDEPGPGGETPGVATVDAE